MGGFWASVREPRRIVAAIAAGMLLLGCTSRRPAEGPTASLRRLRVMTDATAGLRHCRYSNRSPGITLDIGERAHVNIRGALGEVFRMERKDAAPDLIAIPRIVSVNVDQDGLARVDARIAYGVWFETTAGEPVAEVRANGSGGSEYPLLINVVRMVVHLGTLFLFEKADVGRQYRRAMHAAQDDARGALIDALQRSAELRRYATTVREPRVVQARDVALEQLLDAVLAGRPMAIAVLDLQPIAGQPTVVESYLAEEIRTRLAQRQGVRTFERALLARALEELQLGMSDLVDPEHARRFGRIVAADAIVTGTTTDLREDIKLTLRALNTETGEVIGAASTILRKGRGLPGSTGTLKGPGPACP
jgi:hypothetical protein